MRWACRAISVGAVLILAAVAAGCSKAGVTRAERHSVAQGLFGLPAHDYVYEGMDIALLKRLVGEPVSVDREGDRQVWHYGFGVVLVRDGSVEYKYPPSRGQVPPEVPTPGEEPFE